MKKISLLIFSVFCFVTISAQIVEGNIQTIVRSAEEQYMHNDFHNALETYLEGLKRIEGDSTQTPLFKEMARMASVCYDTLDMDKENMLFLEEIMSKSEFTPEEKKIFDYQYSRACLYHGSDLLFGDSSDYEAMREIFNKGLGHATGEIKRETNAYIGYTYYFQGAYAEMDYRYDEAIGYLENARSYFIKGRDLEGILRSETILADIAYAQFRFDDAIRIYEQVEERASQGGARKSRFEALKQIQRITRELDYTDKYLETSLELDSLINSFDKFEDILDGKLHIAVESVKAEDYYRAEDLFREILDISEQMPVGEYRSHYGSLAVSQLRDVFRRQKRYDEAVGFAEKSIEMGIRNKIPRIDLRYLNLLSIYTDKKDKENSYRYLDSIQSCYNDQTPPEILQNFHYIKGNVSAVFGECKNALEEYAIAERIGKESGKEWNDIILEMNKGNMYKTMGNKDEALNHYQAYEKLCIDSYGQNTLEHASAVTALADAEGQLGDFEKGWEDCKRALALITDIIQNRTRFLPSDKKAAYFGKLSENLMTIAAYPVKTGFIPDEGIEYAYDALLLVKGILLASEKSASELILENGSEEEISIYHKMNSLRGMIAQLEGQKEKDLELISQIHAALMTKDMELAAKVSRYADISAFSELDFSTVKTMLGKKDVFVDFFSYTDWDYHRKYAAYVISGNKKTPDIVPLFEESRIDSLIASQNGDVSRLYSDFHIDHLSGMILDPLRPYVDKARNLYLSADGRLHEISFGALRYSERRLMGERFTISRISSAREISNMQSLKLTSPDVLLYGGIIYEMTKEKMLQNAAEYGFPLTRSFRTLRFRQKNTEGFGFLPYTEIEVNNIADVLNNHAQTSCITGEKATEESFMSIDGKSPEILHIATHGFYYSEKDADKADVFANYRDVMNMTGLVMAGANAAWKGEKKIGGVMDGLLTADEISRMDLRNTSLVTLSACNTGKGKVTSEGIYGLQRAFKKAGAQTLIVTLWEASDVATSLFMTTFYQRLVKNGWNTNKAFHEARKIVRKAYPDPFYWAGFVLID